MHNQVDVQHPRVEKLPNQTVSRSKKTPLPRGQNNTSVVGIAKDTPALRVQSNSGPHIIPNDDEVYTSLPPPKLHPISFPTPKGGPFYIPPEEDEISPLHHYPTRNQKEHQANFLATVNRANVNLLFCHTPTHDNHQPLANVVVDEDTG
eukprot:4935820-Ditylum_brightwellii.AAC.1